MKSPVFINGLLIAACLAEIFGIVVQHRQANQLREEQRQYLNDLAAPSTVDAATPAAGQATPASSLADAAASPELLRLRSEATRLSRHKRDLAGVMAEGEHLRAELAARPTDATATAAGLAVPPGFIRKSEARNMGCGTPEDTIQTVLWAIQNRDITNVLAAFTPETAQELLAQFAKKPDFFEGSEALVGLGVVGRQQLAPDLIELSLTPNGDATPQPQRFRLLDGQWKLEKLP